jgi:hypothetical protein
VTGLSGGLIGVPETEFGNIPLSHGTLHVTDGEDDVVEHRGNFLLQDEVAMAQWPRM